MNMLRLSGILLFVAGIKPTLNNNTHLENKFGAFKVVGIRVGPTNCILPESKNS